MSLILARRVRSPVEGHRCPRRGAHFFREMIYKNRGTVSILNRPIDRFAGVFQERGQP